MIVLTKPSSVGELQVALRHNPVFHVDNLCVDLMRRTVAIADETIHLTPTEYRLLVVLVRNAGKVVTHRQLAKVAWGSESVLENQCLLVYQGQLRQMIECDTTLPRYLTIDPGVGYRLIDE